MSTKENTRKKLMYTAVELFSKKGFDGTSTRDICNTAGVNISLISYHFGGKQELYEAIVREFHHDIIEFIGSSIDLNANLEELSQEELVDLIFKSADALVEYFYKKAPEHMLDFVLSDQRREATLIKEPPYVLFRKILSRLFHKDELSKDIVVKSSAIIGVAVFPKLMPMFTLNLVKQDNFTDSDIEIIKQSTKKSIMSILNSYDIPFSKEKYIL